MVSPLTVPAGAFEQHRHKVKYKTRGEDGLRWSIEVYHRRGTWKLKTSSHDTSALDPADGFAIGVRLGNQVGGQDVELTSRGRDAVQWRYHANHRTLCDRLDRR